MAALFEAEPEAEPEPEPAGNAAAGAGACRNRAGAGVISTLRGTLRRSIGSLLAAGCISRDSLNTPTTRIRLAA